MGILKPLVRIHRLGEEKSVLSFSPTPDLRSDSQACIHHRSDDEFREILRRNMVPRETK